MRAGRRRLALPVGIAGLAAATFAFGALVLPQLANRAVVVGGDQPDADERT